MLVTTSKLSIFENVFACIKPFSIVRGSVLTVSDVKHQYDTDQENDKWNGTCLDAGAQLRVVGVC